MSGQILLDGLLQQVKGKYPSGLSDDELFEFYCADNILVNFDLDHSEIEKGIIDGSKDAGIDAAYVFINRQLLREDTKLNAFKQPVEIELIIIQAKNQESFKEGPLDKLSASLPALLSTQDRKALEKAYKKPAVEITGAFLNAMKQLAGEFPKVAVRIFYCSRGDGPNATVQTKQDTLQKTLSAKLPSVEVVLLGAQELYDRSSIQKRLVKALPTVGSPLSGVNSYVALCSLPDYVSFISDTDGSLITRIFDANVRAYQGEVEVNKEISESLKDPSGVDFWWLNNGVTVVADNAQYQSGALTIENPLVVNGLQTSHEIHYHAKLLKTDKRMVLVRIIVENDRERRDAIIRATNRQTGITHSSFRATEPVHKQIEDYLAQIGYFYDRRKNFYKREGKPADKIIGIDRLAQALVSLLLQEPHTARGRPTTVIKSDADYKKIFSGDASQHPLDMYANAAMLLVAVETYFRKQGDTLEPVYKNNLRFHVLMVLGWALNGNKTLPALRIAQLDPSKATAAKVGAVAKWVIQEFKANQPSDKTAKDGKFTAHLKAKWTPAKT